MITFVPSKSTGECTGSCKRALSWADFRFADDKFVKEVNLKVTAGNLAVLTVERYVTETNDNDEVCTKIVDNELVTYKEDYYVGMPEDGPGEINLSVLKFDIRSG